MVGADAMRASDRDRQDVVDRLQGAVAEGRLQMEEYLERMGVAYEAVTLGDLAPLCADLPAVRPAGPLTADAPHVPRPAATAGLPCCLAGPIASARWLLVSVGRLPAVLRVLWAIWLTAVLVNVVVWTLVSVTTGQVLYPWPVWVAGPYGAVLIAASAAVSAGRSIRCR